jgi:GTP cyclohydrolase II
MKILAQSQLPTEFGLFTQYAIENLGEDNFPHIVLANLERIDTRKPINLRIHSECFTGDVLHSIKCDCRAQLTFAQKYIQEHSGLIIYLRQEGRGIGLTNKIKAYHLQDQGLDTIEANKALGLEVDDRNYSIVGEILAHFDIKKINLISNNPLKIKAVKDMGIKIIDRIPTSISYPENYQYLQTKKNKMGHLLDL